MEFNKIKNQLDTKPLSLTAEESLSEIDSSSFTDCWVIIPKEDAEDEALGLIQTASNLTLDTCLGGVDLASRATSYLLSSTYNLSALVYSTAIEDDILINEEEIKIPKILKESYARYEKLLIKANRKGRLGKVTFTEEQIKQSLSKIISKDLKDSDNNLSKEKSQQLAEEMDLATIDIAIKSEFSNTDTKRLIKEISINTLEKSLMKTLSTVVQFKNKTPILDGLHQLAKISEETDQYLEILSQSAVIIKKYINLDPRSSIILEQSSISNLAQFMDLMNLAEDKISKCPSNLKVPSSTRIPHQNLSTKIIVDREPFRQHIPCPKPLNKVSNSDLAEISYISALEEAERIKNKYTQTVKKHQATKYNYRNLTKRTKMKRPTAKFA